MDNTFFLQIEILVALIVSALLFALTIFLVVKRWIRFPMAALLLIFIILSGLAISHYQEVKCYLTNCSQNQTAEIELESKFTNQMVQAVEELKLEIAAEKENLLHIADQIENIFHQLDAQKDKLQSFIEETKEQFKLTTSSKNEEKL